jgi:hypothetical protein
VVLHFSVVDRQGARWRGGREATAAAPAEGKRSINTAMYLSKKKKGHQAVNVSSLYGNNPINSSSPYMSNLQMYIPVHGVNNPEKCPSKSTQTCPKEGGPLNT